MQDVNQPIAKRNVDERVNNMTPIQSNWLGYIGIASGLLMIVSPFIFGYSNLSDPTTNDIICGVVTAVLTAFCLVTAKSSTLSTIRQGAAWFVAFLGAWIVIAPFVFNYYTVIGAVYEDSFTGGFNLILAIAAIVAFRANEEQPQAI